MTPDLHHGLLAVLVSAVVAGGCGGGSAQRGREYTPDMTYSVAYDSFAPNPATRNGMTLQTPVRGTIPRGFLPLHYTNTAAEAERAGRELANPYAHMPSAVEQGFGHAFVTIIDTHVTTIVSSLFLYVFGAGPIRGFAVTLVLGLLVNLFSAVYVSRTIFIWLLTRKGKRVESLSI